MSSSDYKFYKLVKDGETIYVGKTSQHYLSNRMANHRGGFKGWKAGTNRKLYFYTDDFSFDGVTIHLLEKKECDDRESRLIENKLIRDLNPDQIDNKIFNPNYQKEYCEENKVKIAEQHKASYEAHKPERLAKMKVYAEEHRDSIKEYKAQYCQDNKDKIAKQCKERYQENRDSIQEERKKPWTCDQCEKTLTIQHKTRHLKSCKGEVKLVDPDTLFECPNCKQMKGKKHKSRHLKTCIALEKSEVL